MKKMICVLMALILMCSVPVQASELKQNDQIIAFQPVILSVQGQKSSMVVNIDTVSCAFMYQVQWSDQPDFKNAKCKFFRNVDNHGCMIIDYDHVVEKGKLYAVRTIWYGGYKISFRKMQVKSRKQKLTVTQNLISYLRCKYRIQKRLYVPNKGKYVRVRAIYYSIGPYAYSNWTTGVKVK